MTRFGLRNDIFPRKRQTRGVFSVAWEMAWSPDYENEMGEDTSNATGSQGFGLLCLSSTVLWTDLLLGGGQGLHGPGLAPGSGVQPRNKPAWRWLSADGYTTLQRPVRQGSQSHGL